MNHNRNGISTIQSVIVECSSTVVAMGMKIVSIAKMNACVHGKLWRLGGGGGGVRDI